ncbi:uncharacterized protein [Battus philenor]|uniref:uncharacterized protein n=1 Tax=Battus philenor TaxID=42288 RepID=UPI0035CEF3DF
MLSLMVLVLAGGVVTAPMDDPIKIDLPVYDPPSTSPDVINVQAYTTENHPELKSNRQNSDLLSNKLKIASNIIDNKLSAPNLPIGSVNHGGGLFSAPVTTLEGALLETEGLGSKTLSIKDNIHNVAAGIFQPKPLVDTIREEEKYGNNGDKFYSTGRAIVSGAESFSTLVNSVLEIPSRLFNQFTRTATEKLNNLGGKLIGL